jgi:hypothetical protein
MICHTDTLLPSDHRELALTKTPAVMPSIDRDLKPEPLLSFSLPTTLVEIESNRKRQSPRTQMQRLNDSDDGEVGLMLHREATW